MNELEIITDNYSIYQGDCLEVMDELIKQNVKVDAIITDPPYGTTACKWDSVIPFDKMWERINKLIKPNGAIVLFGSEPFSSSLRMSNIKNYKYDWYWNKSKPVGFANAKKMPLKDIETISVFYKKLPIYNPQGLIKCDRLINNSTKQIKHNNISNQNGGAFKTETYKQEFTNFPRQVLKFNVECGLHPTQKPIPLLEYLIKTYTNEDELVLDFTMGSGSTGVACLNTNRKFIGIELDKKYFNIAKKRLEEAKQVSFFNT